jgi:SRSO17 transposase
LIRPGGWIVLMTCSPVWWRRRSGGGSRGCGRRGICWGWSGERVDDRGVAGDRSPLGMQRLLNSAVWDEDEVRDRLVRYVAAELGDPGGVLIADETGFEKAGRFSAGTQRQYTGTAGKITNCQVGVFLAYAVPAAGVRVLTDRELYVPKSWTDNRERCERAGIGEEVKFATKPSSPGR